MSYFLSYLVTCHNEGQQLKSLLSLLTKYLEGNQIVILDDWSNDPDTLNVLSEFNDNPSIKIVKHHLANHYGDHKTYGNQQCDGKYIFQIDADELPNEILLENIKGIIESNPQTELFWVPRVNNFVGITQNDINQWGWRVNEKMWVNWPDYQSRIYKNSPEITWNRKLHETIVGVKQYTRLPPSEELALYHNKTIEKQRETNRRYNQQFSDEDNKGHRYN